MIYTGVGSRKTPPHMFVCIVAIAKALSNHTVRSGAARGADTAFEIGALNSEVYIPFKGFNNSKSHLVLDYFSNKDIAQEIASTIHPAWSKCNHTAKMMHTRNVYQVLGLELDTPSDMLIAWTPDGANGNIPVSINTGGTGTAITLALNLGIPVFNIKNVDDLKTVIKICGEVEFLNEVNKCSSFDGFGQLIKHLETEKIL